MTVPLWLAAYTCRVSFINAFWRCIGILQSKDLYLPIHIGDIKYLSINFPPKLSELFNLNYTTFLKNMKEYFKHWTKLQLSHKWFNTVTLTPTFYWKEYDRAVLALKDHINSYISTLYIHLMCMFAKKTKVLGVYFRSQSCTQTSASLYQHWRYA